MATDEPAPKSSKTWIWITCGVLAFVGLICGGGIAVCMGFGYMGYGEIKKQAQMVKDQPGTPVTAVDLSKAFKDNVASANTQQQMKVLLVTGTVKTVKSPTQIELTGVAGGDIIDCTAGFDNLQLFAGTNVGDTVTVKGLCAGKPLGYIQLTSCATVTKK